MAWRVTHPVRFGALGIAGCGRQCAGETCVSTTSSGGLFVAVETRSFSISPISEWDGVDSPIHLDEPLRYRQLDIPRLHIGGGGSSVRVKRCANGASTACSVVGGGSARSSSLTAGRSCLPAWLAPHHGYYEDNLSCALKSQAASNASSAGVVSSSPSLVVSGSHHHHHHSGAGVGGHGGVSGGCPALCRASRDAMEEQAGPWPGYEGRQDPAVLAQEDMDMFFHTLQDGAGPAAASSYYGNPAARAVHGYRPAHPRVPSSQVCRPHFHSPLHPWISDTAKAAAAAAMVPHHGAAAWCSPFPPAKPQPSPPTAPSHSSPHLFSFPPTPPKDATPDPAAAEAPGYATTASGGCGDDHKPGMLTSLAATSSCGGAGKREGSGPFPASSPPYPHPYVPHPGAPPSELAGYHGFHAAPLQLAAASAAAAKQHSSSSSNALQGPNGYGQTSKPRTKGRSSAGKVNPAALSSEE
ncbi:hypothetical protein HPB50_020437 [Hyalomma asiaticum]|uniref:Uncharacterized protein n=1 Tax=Hyalomma asiaticum TaxID=266040 RepID=A0ACB7S5B1_HYAAI|nr:hypothetical protein HPB50_020437 [Hyalomma asiaticum]